MFILMPTNLSLMTKLRFLAWPTIIFAINSLINQHPLRSKDGQGGGWNSVLYVFKPFKQVSLTNILKAYVLQLFLRHTFPCFSCLNLLINTLQCPTFFYYTHSYAKCKVDCASPINNSNNKNKIDPRDATKTSNEYRRVQSMREIQYNNIVIVGGAVLKVSSWKKSG